MRHSSRQLMFLGALVACASCAADEEPVADADTMPADSVEVTVGDSEMDAPSVVQQSQQTRIGQMQLLGDAQDGTCTVEGDPAVATRYTYTGDWPTRTIRVEVADTSRNAALRMFEVQSTQRAGGIDATESIYVLFTGEGGIQQGSRRFFSSEQPPAREQSGLLPDDSAQVLQVARQVVAWCRRPSGAR